MCRGSTWWKINRLGHYCNTQQCIIPWNEEHISSSVLQYQVQLLRHIPISAHHYVDTIWHHIAHGPEEPTEMGIDYCTDIVIKKNFSDTDIRSETFADVQLNVSVVIRVKVKKHEQINNTTCSYGHVLLRIRTSPEVKGQWELLLPPSLLITMVQDIIVFQKLWSSHHFCQYHELHFTCDNYGDWWKWNQKKKNFVVLRIGLWYEWPTHIKQCPNYSTLQKSVGHTNLIGSSTCRF